MKVYLKGYLYNSRTALILDGNQDLRDSDLSQLTGLDDEQRDKINTVILTRTHIQGQGIAYLKELPNLTSLYLQGTKIGDNAPFEDLPRSIELLNLDHTNVGDLVISKLSALPRLRTLRLTNTAVTDLGAHDLLKIDSLREVYLEGTATSEQARQRLENNIVLNDMRFDSAIHYAKFYGDLALGALTLRSRIRSKSGCNYRTIH